MQVTKSECVSCGRPCIGKACPYYEVTRFYCDRCKKETTLYMVDDEELCVDCLLKDFEVVEGSL